MFEIDLEEGLNMILVQVIYYQLSSTGISVPVSRYSTWVLRFKVHMSQHAHCETEYY